MPGSGAMPLIQFTLVSLYIRFFVVLGSSIMNSKHCRRNSAFPWIHALQLSSDSNLPFCSPQLSTSPDWKEEQSKDYVISTVVDILSHRRVKATSCQDRDA